jgi:hypothetical protein
MRPSTPPCGVAVRVHGIGTPVSQPVPYRMTCCQTLVCRRVGGADLVLMSHVLEDFPPDSAFFGTLLNEVMGSGAQLLVFDRFARTPRCLQWCLESGSLRSNWRSAPVRVPGTRSGRAGWCMPVSPTLWAQAHQRHCNPPLGWIPNPLTLLPALQPTHCVAPSCPARKLSYSLRRGRAWARATGRCGRGRSTRRTRTRRAGGGNVEKTERRSCPRGSRKSGSSRRMPSTDSPTYPFEPPPWARGP